MRRALWIEVRRSSLLWWLPLILGFQLVMLFFRSYQWEFAWSEASAAIGVAAGISAPLVAAAAAWEGTRWHRSGDLSVFHHHARFAGAGYLLHLQSILLLVTVPLSATGLIAWAVTVSASGFGLLWPSYLVFALAVQWGIAGFGYTIGRLVGTRLVVPAAVLIVMLGLMLLPGGHPFAMMSINGASGMTLLPQAVTARVAIAAVLLALGLLVVGKHGDVWVRRWPGWSLVAAGTVVMIVAAQTMATGGPIHRPRDAADITPLCTRTTVEICVWPDQAGFLPELTGYAHRLETLSTVADVPDRYEEANLAHDDVATFTLQSSTGSWIRVTGLAFWIDADRYPTECSPDAGLDFATWASQSQQLTVWYSHWIFGGPPPPGNGGGPPYDRAAMAELIAQPERAQLAWAGETRDRLVAVRPCDADGD